MRLLVGDDIPDFTRSDWDAKSGRSSRWARIATWTGLALALVGLAMWPLRIGAWAVMLPFVIGATLLKFGLDSWLPRIIARTTLLSAFETGNGLFNKVRWNRKRRRLLIIGPALFLPGAIVLWVLPLFVGQSLYTNLLGGMPLLIGMLCLTAALVADSHLGMFINELEGRAPLEFRSQ